MSYNQIDLTETPDVIPAKRNADQLATGNANGQSVPIHLHDYVNAFVMNDHDEVLILEGTENGRSWASWKLIGRSLNGDEDPMLAVQQDLKRRTGYACSDWTYLGTFVTDESQKRGAGHFFCAKWAKQITIPEAAHSHNIALKWVSKREMKQALLDGRIAVINHAAATSLALVMCSSLE